MLSLYAFLVLMMTASALGGKKVNDRGVYQRYPGNTLICPVEDAPVRWAKVHEFLSSDPAIRKIYSPLPMESYHMTVFPLFAEHEEGLFGREFQRFVWSKISGYVDLQKTMESREVRPRVFLEGVVARGILGLSLRVLEEDSTWLQEFRRQVASKLGLEYSSRYGFHLTLGYLYDPVGAQSMTQEDKRALRESLTTLEGLILDHACVTRQSREILLRPATFTVFEDMTKFVPSDPRTWKDPISDNEEL